MRLGATLKSATLRIAQPRVQTVAQTNLLMLEGQPMIGPAHVDGEPLASLGFSVFGGAEGDGEYIMTLGMVGAAVVTAGQTLATLGMVGEDGAEAGGAYLTTLGVAE